MTANLEAAADHADALLASLGYRHDAITAGTAHRNPVLTPDLAASVARVETFLATRAGAPIPTAASPEQTTMFERWVAGRYDRTLRVWTGRAAITGVVVLVALDAAGVV